MQSLWWVWISLIVFLAEGSQSELSNVKGVYGTRRIGLDLLEEIDGQGASKNPKIVSGQVTRAQRDALFSATANKRGTRDDMVPAGDNATAKPDLDPVDSFKLKQRTGSTEAETSQEVKTSDAKDTVVGGDLGVPQLIPWDSKAPILEAMQRGRDYMENFVERDEAYAPVRNLCQNKHKHCALWAAAGECEANPKFMKTECAPLCHSCGLVHVDTKCRADPEAPFAWGPGDLHALFERITTDPEMKQYKPKVLSRPSNGDEEYKANSQIGPWIVLLDNFLTVEETERMVQLGAEEGYKQSGHGGRGFHANGTEIKAFSSTRTSENAWCMEDCLEDPIAQKVLKKLYHVTQIPNDNSEYLQLLKYEEGQSYNIHTDYIDHHKKQLVGVRILTVFLYLSDVEEGGETDFPKLNLTVLPKRGTALLWPSVLDEAPNNMDGRTEHQALPVHKGIKYAANAWYHQKDYKAAHAIGCG